MKIEWKFRKIPKEQKIALVKKEWAEFYAQRFKHLKDVELMPEFLAEHQVNIIIANGELDKYFNLIQNYQKKMRGVA